MELDIRDLIDIRRPDEIIEADFLIEAPDTETAAITRKEDVSAGDKAPGTGSADISVKSVNDTSYRPAHLAYSGMGSKDVSAVPSPLFWSFPAGRGAKQPWRTRLWEHRSSKS